MKKLFLTVLCALLPLFSYADGYIPAETSVAGFFNFEGSGRKVYNFNLDWRFLRGDAPGAEAVDFDDSRWELVTAPHSVQLEPSEASGNRNYQGPCWYRKRFVVPDEAGGMRVFVHFEAIMGKQQIYINGNLAKEHLGGFLPITVSLTDQGIQAGDTCVIAVRADNSDDTSYPPGKTQYTMDFAYHGGMYRDVWLIAKSTVAVTDAILANKVAGGGVFVHYDNITEKSADVYVDTDVENTDSRTRSVTVETTLRDADGKVVKVMTSRLALAAGSSQTANQRFTVKNPHLWSPESPYLYKVETRIRQGSRCLDGGVTRIGIRLCEFRGSEGFFLNGKRYDQLIGANRHQDFAIVGNAMPNSQHWRDVKRLRDIGCRIIRTAHYPQDPAFMDACDELGMFVIVATPGWQFWNDDPEFAERVHQNTRDIIRRDRNHPAVLMWEPILNETHFPEQFALDALQLTHDEYPYPGRPVTAADVNSRGVKANYDLVYGKPGDDEQPDAAAQCIFTREWGDIVDDWYAHNAVNRASRAWGERALTLQALSLADSYGTMFRTTGKFIGGAQWHPFDHQRGYHPDAFYGGLFDAFRQPKYARYMFRSQVPADRQAPYGVESGPMVYIAHEMMPTSATDVVVFSNCDSVRLTLYDGAVTQTLPVLHPDGGIPNQPVVFADAWDPMEARRYSYGRKEGWRNVNMVAEGIIDGCVVCTDRRMPSRRSTRLQLSVDWEGQPLVADGSDFVVVTAYVTDDNGNVRRLAMESVVFTVEGEGEIIGDAYIGANPRRVEWGTAPVLIRATHRAGPITVRAQPAYAGTHAPAAAEISFESIAPALPLCRAIDITSSGEASSTVTIPSADNPEAGIRLSDDDRRRLLNEVEEQQKEFGIQ